MERKDIKEMLEYGIQISGIELEMHKFGTTFNHLK
jgi:hypothetical protein